MKRYIIHIIFIGIIVILVGLGLFYHHVTDSPNIVCPEGEKISLYLPDSCSFEELLDSLNSKKILVDEQDLRLFYYMYGGFIFEGHYLLHDDYSNEDFMEIINNGLQTPIHVTFNNNRTLEDLAGKVSRYFAFDSLALITEIYRQDVSPTLFLPDSYEMYYTATPAQFVARMRKEYNIFWQGRRDSLAVNVGLSRDEVSILASIVDKETNKASEMPDIAGVYLNRLRKNWPLQADPTLIFATKDFGARRVLKKHITFDSPYNTYKHRGLPPGPICIPSKRAIDAVLQNKQHNYMFFCASSKRDGSHNFSTTLNQHNSHAKSYHKVLDSSL